MRCRASVQYCEQSGQAWQVNDLFTYCNHMMHNPGSLHFWLVAKRRQDTDEVGCLSEVVQPALIFILALWNMLYVARRQGRSEASWNGAMGLLGLLGHHEAFLHVSSVCLGFAQLVL
jgi:hypothetical protein